EGDEEGDEEMSRRTRPDGLDLADTGELAAHVVDDAPFDASGLTPEQQIRNIAQVVMDYTQVTRDHNGHGRPPTYVARVDAIAGAARQLAEMVVAHLDQQHQWPNSGDVTEDDVDAF